MGSKLWKLCLDRLKQAELSYELESRGLSLGTISEMRISVRNVFKSDFNDSFRELPYTFVFKDDVEAVDVGLKELEQLKITFDGNVKHKSFRRISALLLYLIRRVNRSLPVTADDVGIRNNLLLRVLDLQSNLEHMIRKPSAVTGRTDTKSPISSEYSTPNSSPVVSDSDSEVLVSPVSNRSIIKPVPVSQWGLKFSGGPECSVSAFLERVKELRKARNISVEQLFDSAIDLFSDDALLWYRSIRLEVTSWDELQSRLRRAFMPTDYDDQLNNEIYHRIQGANERPTLFVAAMRRLYQRLNKLPSTSEQLRRIMKNLLPVYAQALALKEIKSFDELQKCLERLEETSLQSKRTSPMVLEPDLACKEKDALHIRRDRPRSSFSRNSELRRPDSFALKRNSSIHAPVATTQLRSSNMHSSTSVVKCWNCGESGHAFAKCSLPRKKFCFRCGKPDVTVCTCTKCGFRSGKGFGGNRTE